MLINDPLCSSMRRELIDRSDRFRSRNFSNRNFSRLFKKPQKSRAHVASVAGYMAENNRYLRNSRCWADLISRNLRAWMATLQNVFCRLVCNFPRRKCAKRRGSTKRPFSRIIRETKENARKTRARPSTREKKIANDKSRLGASFGPQNRKKSPYLIN